ncbi:MAG: YggS family pyridoxal phosphate enzyme [Microthrixaceae bacterium]
MSTPEEIHSELVEQIAARAADLQRRISNCTDRTVKVICVTKGHDLQVKAAAHEAGFRDLGENYAQELVAGAAVLGAGITEPTCPQWHFIGGLQTNKVRSLALIVSLWQSVDRLSLAKEIAVRAPAAQVLVQVDLAGLSGRSGVAPNRAAELVGQCRDLGLQVLGLMGVGVPGIPEDSRSGFRLLANLAEELGLPECSMGMSNDFEVAVSEGSTMLRVGSLLLGPRAPR